MRKYIENAKKLIDLKLPCQKLDLWLQMSPHLPAQLCVQHTCSNMAAGVCADVGACAGVLDASAGVSAASQRVCRRKLMFFHGARL